MLHLISYIATNLNKKIKLTHIFELLFSIIFNWYHITHYSILISKVKTNKKGTPIGVPFLLFYFELKLVQCTFKSSVSVLTSSNTLIEQFFFVSCKLDFYYLFDTFLTKDYWYTYTYIFVTIFAF